MPTVKFKHKFKIGEVVFIPKQVKIVKTNVVAPKIETYEKGKTLYIERDEIETEETNLTSFQVEERVVVEVKYATNETDFYIEYGLMNIYKDYVYLDEVDVFGKRKDCQDACDNANKYEEEAKEEYLKEYYGDRYKTPEERADEEKKYEEDKSTDR